MKKRQISILIFITLFLGYYLSQFSNSLNPYVNFAEAKSLNTTVQIKGTLSKDNDSITYENKQLKFFLRGEQNEKILVSYKGIKPENFEHAESIVAIGKYNNDQFIAEKLLVKCPSKYERKGEPKP